MNTIEILRDHSETALKIAIEDNILQYMRASVIPGEEVLDTSEIFRWYCGSNILLRNWVLNAKFTPENVISKVREQMDYFKERKVTFLWWNGPSAEPLNLGEIMQDLGMIKFNIPPKSGDMVMDIRDSKDMERKLNEIVKKTGITLQKIKSTQEIRDAANVVVKTMGLSREFQRAGEQSCELMLKEDTSVNALVGYIAYLKNKPVSVSTVFYGAGVAGLYNVGTLPKYRHRGIGTAITLAPLVDAWKRGYEIAVLTATPSGFPIYERIGFKKHHAMDQFFWTPQPFRRFLYKMYFRLQRVKFKKK